MLELHAILTRGLLSSFKLVPVVLYACTSAVAACACVVACTVCMQCAVHHLSGRSTASICLHVGLHPSSTCWNFRYSTAEFVPKREFGENIVASSRRMEKNPQKQCEISYIAFITTASTFGFWLSVRTATAMNAAIVLSTCLSSCLHRSPMAPHSVISTWPYVNA